MTDAELDEAFALLKQHASPIVHPLADSLHRMLQLERASAQAVRAQVNILHAAADSLYVDNRHQSRKVKT